MTALCPMCGTLKVYTANGSLVCDCCEIVFIPGKAYESVR